MNVKFVHQVENQLSLYYDARSTNDQEVILYVVTFHKACNFNMHHHQNPVTCRGAQTIRCPSQHVQTVEQDYRKQDMSTTEYQRCTDPNKQLGPHTHTYKEPPATVHGNNRARVEYKQYNIRCVQTINI
jgi:hypothetical protein